MLIHSNNYSGNIYKVSVKAANTVRHILWSFSNILFATFTDRSRMIFNAFFLPIDVDYVYTNNPNSPIRPAWQTTEKIYFGTEYVDWDEYSQLAADTPLYLFNGGAFFDSLVAKYELTSEAFENLLTKSYIDYPTLTEYDLYLPFFNYQTIDYIYLKDGITVEYYLNITNGDLVCNVTSNSKRVLELNTNIATKVVMSGADYGALRDTLINSAFSMVGASLGMAMPSISTRTSTNTISGGNETVEDVSTTSARNPDTNRLIQTNKEVSTHKVERTPLTRSSKSSQSFVNVGAHVNSAINALGNLASMRPTSTIRCESSSSTSFNFINECFLKIRRPFRVSSTYDNLKEYQGRPTQATYRLNQCNGYVQVGMIHLNINTTLSELQEIENLLHTGVIINNPTAPEIIIDNTETQTVEV